MGRPLTGREYRAKILKAQQPKKRMGRPNHPQKADAETLLRAGQRPSVVADRLGIARSTVDTWAKRLRVELIPAEGQV